MRGDERAKKRRKIMDTTRERKNEREFGAEM